VIKKRGERMGKTVIELPRNVEMIMDRLNSFGFRADVVGGAVRDLYLGREAGDFDITTNARPEQIKEIFSDIRTIDTGLKHGTVTIHINGENYEVTTYRLDGEYIDGRHPESVEFTDELVLDLSRRDFTMNAICYNRKDGFTDLFGGMSDISNRIIRTVGDARERFSEDALRILRAVRFAAVLDFSIDDDTRAAIFDKKELLNLVSRERIYIEWCKLLSGSNAYRVLEEYRDVLLTVIPELGELRLPDADLFKSAAFMTRQLSLFALGSAEPHIAYDLAMRSLHTDNKSRRFGADALLLYRQGLPSCLSDTLFALKKYGIEATDEAMKLGVLLGEIPEHQLYLTQEAINSGIPYKLSMMNIKGNDLINMGVSGVRIGEILDTLLDALIRGECNNTRDSLIEYVAK
jgi:tRNA nucleotidyltransferase (CCA-adding enzyme)